VPQTLTPNGQGNLATSFSYTGALAPATVTGPNAASQQFVYDSYGRPQTSANPHGGVTGYAYGYGPHTTTVTFGVKFTRTTLDGVGRTIKVETGVSGNPAESVVDTEYEPCACSPLGKAKRVSQPHTPAQTPVWTTFTYDALGRTTRVDLPDGSFTTTSYLANVTTVTDPAGKWKKYTNDALGNLTKVQEPNPAGGADLETAYVYDYLDRLKTVTQIRSSTTQTRTFTYDALERLQSVSHPESGATSYTYNSDRTVASKTDAKGQKVEYGYDGFQRVIQIKRFPTPPTEDLCQRTLLYYDVNPFNPGDTSGKRWGRLAATQWFVPANGTCAGGGHRFTELYDYTVGGLVAKKRLYVKLNDTTWPNALADLGVLRELNYSYDGSGLGLLAGMTYPSGTGQQLTYVYDSLQRPVQLNNTGANPLVQGITYGPGNEMKTLQHLGWVAGSTGNYYAEQRQYNNRLQLTRITGNFIPPAYATPANGIDLEYRYTTAQNNGQMSQQKDWISGEEITYQYDSLTRLISAATTGPEWGLSFAYDGFGNRTNQTVTKGSGPSSALTYNSLNRINGFNYDNNGNITWMSSGVTLTYDAENRSTTMQGGFGTERYGYDPRNQRVYRKKADGTEEFTLWGASSERIETFRIVSGAAQTQTTNIYFAGRLMRTKNHTTGNETALVTDRVGSVAVRVNPSGINEKLRYYPYGEEYTATTNDRDKFATYSRDSSTGLDYAVNRYYGSNLGRFLTPDPFGGSGKPNDPGSWNRYAYVGGDPVNKNDPSGLDSEDGLGLEGFYDFWARRESHYGNEPASPKARWDRSNCWFPSFDGLSSEQKGLFTGSGEYDNLSPSKKASFLNITYKLNQYGVSLSGLSFFGDGGAATGILTDQLKFRSNDAATRLSDAIQSKVATGAFVSDKPKAGEHPGMADAGVREFTTFNSLQVGWGDDGVFADIDPYGPIDAVGIFGHIFLQYFPNKIGNKTTDPFRVGKGLYDNDPGNVSYNCYR